MLVGVIVLLNDLLDSYTINFRGSFKRGCNDLGIFVRNLDLSKRIGFKSFTAKGRVHYFVINSVNDRKRNGSFRYRIIDICDIELEEDIDLLNKFICTRLLSSSYGSITDADQRSHYPTWVLLPGPQQIQCTKEEFHEVMALKCSSVSSCGTPAVLMPNLHEAALHFRLLRQEGYLVPSDVFQQFLHKMNDGTQNKKPEDYDVLGLISLFEASQLGTEGEDVLDEVGESIGQRLYASLADLDHVQARFVRNSLNNPFHKSLARFTANDFLRNFVGRSYSWTKNLGELAHLDMNIVGSVHQREILQVSNWWKDLGMEKELKYARDQPLKWYMWPMAILTKIGLSQERVLVTKPISFIYIIDDIFDVYGTIDELTLFTDVVNRWECTEKDNIPDYMRMCFHALDDITNEVSLAVSQNHGWNPLYSLRKTWARLLIAFLVEARWLASGHSPTTQDYLDNAIVSSGVHVLLVHLFFLLGERINPQSVGHLENVPEIVSSTATILRLWDDLGSAQDEFQDGRDGSYVECYKQEFQGSSEEVAQDHVKKLISEAWKRLNKACLYPRLFPKSFCKASLNTARMVPLMYNYDDSHSLPLLEHHMKSLLLGGHSL
ncbi:hypothetical protein BT93_B1228 [Corymbia citriodora subsp. variegata]|nr:hypothetical protein BT93_B1228 [Corymbia citriodora subsp. variegata]